MLIGVFVFWLVIIVGNVAALLMVQRQGERAIARAVAQAQRTASVVEQRLDELERKSVALESAFAAKPKAAEPAQPPAKSRPRGWCQVRDEAERGEPTEKVKV